MSIELMCLCPAGNMPMMNIEITVIDTDYSTYAILLYKRMKNITYKLYGRLPE